MNTIQKIIPGILVFLIPFLHFNELRAQTMAYGYVISSPILPEGPCRFILENPDSIISLAATTSPDPIVANTWGNGHWWAVEAWDPANGLNHGHLYTIDTLTGSMTDIGPLNQNLDALAYNHWSDSLFGLKSIPDSQGHIRTYIYFVNTTNGNTQLFDSLYFDGNIGGFAYNYNTNRYFIETDLHRYYSNAEKSEITPDHEFNLSATINSPGDMACNLNNNTMYILSDLEGGELVSVDTSKIHGHLLGNLPAGTRLSGLAIPFDYTHPSGEDVGIVSIMYPKSGCSTDGQPVIILIKNFGTQTVFNFDIGFVSKNSNNTVEAYGWEHFNTGSLGNYIIPGDMFSYVFFPFWDTPLPGEHTVYSWISNFQSPPNVYPHHEEVNLKFFNQYCFPLACPDSSISESEICGEMGNDGCEMAEASFDTIVPGNTICGDNWHYEEMGDQDWFYFEIDSIRKVKFTARASTRLDIAVKTLPCENSSLVALKTIEPNTSDSLEVNLLPGKYAFIVNVNIDFYNVVCPNPNNYYFHFETSTEYTCNVATDTLGQDSLYINELTVGNNTWNNAPSPDGYTQIGNLMNPLNGNVQAGILIKTANSLPGDKASIWFDLNRNLAFDNPGERMDMTYNSVLQQWELPNPGFTFPASGLYNARVRVSRNGTPEPCGLQPGTDAVDFRVFVFTGPATLSFHLIENCAGESRIKVRVQNAFEVTQLNFSIVFSASGMLPEIENINPILGNNCLTMADSAAVQFIWSDITPLTLQQTDIFDIRLSPGWSPVTVINDLSLTNIIAGNQYTYPCLCSANLTFDPDACMYPQVWLRYADTGGAIISGNNTVNYLGLTAPYYQTMFFTSGSQPALGILANGTYQISATTDHPWGGVNATDALLILKHFTGMSLLSGLPLKVADVNADQYVNSVDALLVLKRFTGMISTFVTGDWLIEPKTVNFTGSGPGPVHIPGLCFGDVNASYGL